MHCLPERELREIKNPSSGMENMCKKLWNVLNAKKVSNSHRDSTQDSGLQ